MASEKYLILAQKLRNSMLDGEPNAEIMLHKLMQKHGITEEQLDDAHKKTHYFTPKSDESKLILFQCIAKVVNHDEIYEGGRGKIRNFALECTKAEAAEINIMYDFFYQKFMEKIEILRTAFLLNNKLIAQFQYEFMQQDGDKKGKKTDKSRSIKKVMNAIGSDEYQKQLV